MPFTDPTVDNFGGENRYALIAPSSKLVALTPHATNDIATGIKSLRVFNTTTGTIAAKVRPLGAPADGSGDATLKFSPGLTVEPIRITKLFTSPDPTGLEFHGYTD